MFKCSKLLSKSLEETIVKKGHNPPIKRQTVWKCEIALLSSLSENLRLKQLWFQPTRYCVTLKTSERQPNRNHKQWDWPYVLEVKQKLKCYLELGKSFPKSFFKCPGTFHSTNTELQHSMISSPPFIVLISFCHNSAPLLKNLFSIREKYKTQHKYHPSCTTPRTQRRQTISQPY